MHMCVLSTALLRSLRSACTEGEDLCSPTWKQREDIYNEATTGMPRQVHSLFLQILWHHHGRNVSAAGVLPHSHFVPLPRACQAELILHWVCSQASEMGPDREARPLPALAAQGSPFPSNSTIPPLPSGTCPNTFALNRIAFKSLGLPTHVKGTAGGEKQGKAATAPARRKKGASSRAQSSAPAPGQDCGRAAGCRCSDEYPSFPSHLLSKRALPQLTFGFSSQD